MLLAGAVVGALVATGACGGDDDGGVPESEAELAEALEHQQDLSPEQARCVAAQVYARLTDDELAALVGSSAEDLPTELRSKLRTALTPCAAVP